MNTALAVHGKPNPMTACLNRSTLCWIATDFWYVFQLNGIFCYIWSGHSLKEFALIALPHAQTLTMTKKLTTSKPINHFHSNYRPNWKAMSALYAIALVLQDWSPTISWWFNHEKIMNMFTCRCLDKILFK